MVLRGSQRRAQQWMQLIRLQLRLPRLLAEPTNNIDLHHPIMVGEDCSCRALMAIRQPSRNMIRCSCTSFHRPRLRPTLCRLRWPTRRPRPRRAPPATLAGIDIASRLRATRRPPTRLRTQQVPAAASPRAPTTVSATSTTTTTSSPTPTSSSTNSSRFPPSGSSSRLVQSVWASSSSYLSSDLSSSSMDFTFPSRTSSLSSTRTLLARPPSRSECRRT